MAGSYNRSRGGLFAKKAGSGFEHRFYHYCNGEEDTCCVRVFDGCLRVAKNKLIQTFQPFDFIVVHKKRVIFCDTKTTQSGSYSINEKKVAYQLQELGRLAKMGQCAGYLIEYREIGEYRFFPIETIREILKTRKSLPAGLGIFIGETWPMEILFDKILDQ